jgi:Lactate racemase N-terminal domain
MPGVLRIPLHSGSRLPLVSVPEGATLLAAPPPLDPLADVRAAVVEALRYPLSGPPLQAVAPRGGRATVVVQPPTVPLPSVEDDPRRDALAAVLDELATHGVPRERITVLVVGALGRRAGRRELEVLLRRDRARDFRGRIVVHDCEAEDLHPLTAAGRVHRINRAIVETDLVVTVGAGETVLHGGASALVDACAPGTIREAGAVSLLEATTASGWRLASTLESTVGREVPVLGLSVVLDHPRITGLYRGYPWDRNVRRALGRSPFRRILNAAPSLLRRRLLAGINRELRAVAVLAGAPSVAHAEALVRGVAVRSVEVARPFDTIVVPLPWEGTQLPRGPLNPVAAAALGLGHVMRLWRGRPPLVEGGTIVLLHPFSRVTGDGEVPYRALLASLRAEGDRRLRAAEGVASRDRRALSAYRSGTAPHPRLPFAEWASCAEMLGRAGRVIVAGCRDAGAARALGLVPSHNAATALDMARGLAGDDGSTAVFLGPPYPPLVVTEPADAGAAG